MVDAMATGYSRAATPELTKKFLGVRGDVQAFGEFIRLYLSRYERWPSPLFLLGESYGTTRAAGIAGYLADNGISFNGVTLLSDGSRLPDSGMEQVERPALRAAVANVHRDRRLSSQTSRRPLAGRGEGSPGRQRTGQANDYLIALAKGDALTSGRRRKIVDQLARLHRIASRGNRAQQRAHRRTRPSLTNSCSTRNYVVGRLDGRFTSPDPEDHVRLRPNERRDPAALIRPSFTTTCATTSAIKRTCPTRVFAFDEKRHSRSGNGETP